MRFPVWRGIALMALTAVSLAPGCGNLPGATTPPAGGVPSIGGRITFKGGNPGQALALSLKKFDGSAWQRQSNTTTTDINGNYTFNSLNNGRYQVFYDDQGQVVTDPQVNTVGVYVSTGVDVASGSTATSNFDVSWPFNPSIAPNAAFTVGTSTFGFAANGNAPGAEYQVLVGDSNKSAVWSSAWASTTSFGWNGNRGTETNSPTGAKEGSGTHFYQVKFRKAGTVYGGDGYYGQTKWVPFTLTNP